MKKHTSRTLLRIGKAKITQETITKLVRPLQLALGLKPKKPENENKSAN